MMRRGMGMGRGFFGSIFNTIGMALRGSVGFYEVYGDGETVLVLASSLCCRLQFPTCPNILRKPRNVLHINSAVFAIHHDGSV